MIMISTFQAHSRRGGLLYALLLLAVIGILAVGAANADDRATGTREGAETEEDWRGLVEAAAYAYEARRPYQAQELLERAVGKTEPGSEERAAVLNNLAIVLETNGHLSAAEQLYVRVIGLWTALLGPDDINVARTLGNLADLHHRQGQLEEAAEAYGLALQSIGLVSGPEAEQVRGILEEGQIRVRDDQERQASEGGAKDRGS